MSSNITKDTVIALKNGDHAAFESIFLFYFNKVKYFISGFIKSESDAEELAQEIFVRIWTNRDSIDPDQNFNTHVYMASRDATMNFLRNKYACESLAEGRKEPESEDVIMAREIDLLVDMALMKMPAERKAIYEMNRKNGLSNEEIAMQLSISPKTVEKQMALALKELKSIIKIFIMLIC